MLVRDYPRARELHERAKRLAAEQSNRFLEIVMQAGLGSCARREGALDLVETHLRSALKLYRQIGHEPGVVSALAELGFVAEQRGNAAEAFACHLDGFDIARTLDNPRAVALALEGLAGAQAVAGRPPAACQK